MMQKVRNAQATWPRRCGPIEGEERIPSGCAIAGMFHKKGGKIGGETIIRAMEPMHDRSNGLGGGFAGYGIYPEYAQCYAFHLFYDDENSRETCEQYLKRYFDIASMSLMPVRRSREITDAPIIWRYFVQPKAWRMEEEDLDEKAYTARHVLEVNKAQRHIRGGMATKRKYEAQKK